MKKTALLMTCITCISSVAHGAHELIILDDSTNSSAALSINSYGFSSGYKNTGTKSEPYIWSPAGGYINLPIPVNVTYSGVAAGINDNFQTVGTFAFGALIEGSKGIGRAIVWNFDTTNGFVPQQVMADDATVRGINRSGKVAGGQNWCGVVRDLSTTTTYIMPESDSLVHAINDQGNATGSFQLSGATYRCMYLQTNSSGAYDTIVGPSLGFNAVGLGINTSNQIVGTCRTYGPFSSIVLSGFYWDPQTGSNEVFAAESQCFGISDNGTIVGTKNGRAVLWKKQLNGSFIETDLNTLIDDTNTVMTVAYAINSVGQIVGQCLEVNTGFKHAFLLTTATPAPTCLTTIGGSTDLKLGWQSVTDHTYRIKYSNDLITWESIPGIYWADSSDSWVTLIPEGEKGFFKVVDLTP